MQNNIIIAIQFECTYDHLQAKTHKGNIIFSQQHNFKQMSTK